MGLKSKVSSVLADQHSRLRLIFHAEPVKQLPQVLCCSKRFATLVAMIGFGLNAHNHFVKGSYKSAAGCFYVRVSSWSSSVQKPLSWRSMHLPKDCCCNRIVCSYQELVCRAAAQCGRGGGDAVLPRSHHVSLMHFVTCDKPSNACHACCSVTTNP